MPNTLINNLGLGSDTVGGTGDTRQSQSGRQSQRNDHAHPNDRRRELRDIPQLSNTTRHSHKGLGRKRRRGDSGQEDRREGGGRQEY